MSDFETFKEYMAGKEMFYSLLAGKKFSNKEYEDVLNVWNIYGKKTMKEYHDLVLKKLETIA